MSTMTNAKRKLVLTGAMAALLGGMAVAIPSQAVASTGTDKTPIITGDSRPVPKACSNTQRIGMKIPHSGCRSEVTAERKPQGLHNAR